MYQQLRPHIYAYQDQAGAVSYLVLGEIIALMVDGGFGFQNPLQYARLITKLPIQVVLTHAHPDHVGGCFYAPQVFLPKNEKLDRASCFEAQCIAAKHMHVINHLTKQLVETCSFHTITAGTILNLGKLHVRVVALPGHTRGSVGYFVEEDAVILSGDAVTPIMSLCFPESCDLATWQRTLCTLDELSWQSLYCGHYLNAFAHADLPSFQKAAQFAASDKGHAWQHSFIPSWKGIMHICPASTYDAEDPQFRAVICKATQEISKI